MTGRIKPGTRILGSAVAALGACLGLAGALLAWFFRDGLGPESVNSSGTVAVGRALADGWHMLLPGISLLCVGVVLLLRARRPGPN